MGARDGDQAASLLVEWPGEATIMAAFHAMEESIELLHPNPQWAEEVRNSGMITRVAFRPCEAALVSVSRDDEAEDQVRYGLLHWLRLKQRELENPENN